MGSKDITIKFWVQRHKERFSVSSLWIHEANYFNIASSFGALKKAVDRFHSKVLQRYYSGFKLNVGSSFHREYYCKDMVKQAQ